MGQAIRTREVSETRLSACNPLTCISGDVQGRDGHLDTKVEDVVRKLRAAARAAGFEFALKVGKIVVEEFYGGDLQGFRRRGRKEISLRRLAQHPELPMSPSALYRCLAVYELSARMPSFASWRHISVSHVRMVLGLPEDAQRSLLERADDGCWSVARLSQEVRSLQPMRGSPAKPTPIGDLGRLTSHLQRVMEDCRRLAADENPPVSPEAA